MRWAVAPSDRTDSPCDRTAALSVPKSHPTSLTCCLSDLFLFFPFIHEGLCWFSSRDTSLDLAIHNRTASLDTGRLCRWFESHHGLGGWAKRLVMSQKARVAKGHKLPKVVSCQRSRVTKGCELPKGVSNQRVQVAKGYEHQEGVSNQRVQVAKGYEHQEVRGPRGTKDRRGACSKRCLLRQVVSDPYGSVYDLLSQDRPKAGSGKKVRWAIEPDFVDRSHLDSIRIRLMGSYLFIIILPEELRMVLVQPRSREGSVSERLCNVWLDVARDELVIFYETVKKLCIGSQAGKIKSGKVRKGKRTAGQFSRGAADGAGLSELPTDPVETNIGGVLPSDLVNLTRTQQDGQQHQEGDEEVESSNANRDGDQREKRVICREENIYVMRRECSKSGIS
ncbi:hypothetical protein F2Q70_00027874 [Brassica cretica]|uniref:Uncharacterized protein n=1 Tax=Brassica cretica TaxID=69181 RepID=A0A8S9L841_BRACR|nr:hypothetical protein F2Q70_00027874 [Brassica cretica]